jgi:hypothetical protein
MANGLRRRRRLATRPLTCGFAIASNFPCFARRRPAETPVGTALSAILLRIRRLGIRVPPSTLTRDYVRWEELFLAAQPRLSACQKVGGSGTSEQPDKGLRGLRASDFGGTAQAKHLICQPIRLGQPRVGRRAVTPLHAAHVWHSALTEAEGRVARPVWGSPVKRANFGNLFT